MIPFSERIEIVRSIKYVDAVIAQEDLNKIDIWKKVKFDLMVVGDDWYNSKKWKKIDDDLIKKKC